ncbi:MAG: 1-(5-phosphoribosyl)-5-[(5-phosphoribosylamino)methylideneamino]imidazole-4-carboxamide isomerase [Candidatus Omnitrophica bacterium]|nr:1-(5-phosphoribosyl)-5-[(5-phosphoribosylamino)methylideneamino]imidazole-4-carboxamide isomerase [Candidatus Omnitrophota bacterium]
MIIYPAIDIKNRNVVRLMQGRFDDVTQYGDNPLSAAQQWIDSGARWLHIIDLDGARTGTMHNKDIIKSIARSVSVPIQTGGGIRTKEDIQDLLDAGIKRVILGTAVIEDRNFLKEILSLWPENIAVSLDCKEGRITEKGWTVTRDIFAVDFAKELEAAGLKYLIYTDISRDGMLSGPNLESLNELLDNVNISLIASGGIKNIDDIKQLSVMREKGLIGAITGKALYEGTLNLKEALEIC